MTDEQKRTQEEQGNTFDFSCCGDRSKVKPDQTEGCACAGMIARMMEMCDGVESETTTPEEPDTPKTSV